MAIYFDDLWEQFLYDFLQVDYSHVTGDFMQDFIWIVFMPTIVLLFYMEFALSQLAGSNKNGMKHLIAIGIFVYIITQGLYGIFVSITKPFFGLIVIIGLILMLLRHIPDILVRDKTSSGKPSGNFLSSIATGGAGGYALRSIRNERNRIEDELRELDDMVNKTMTLHKAGKSDNDAMNNAIVLDSVIETKIANLESRIRNEGLVGGKLMGNHEKRLENIIRKWQKRMKV